MSGPAITRQLPVYEQFKINRYHAASLIITLGGSIVYNVMSGKPRSAGMLRHGGALLVGYFIGDQSSLFMESRRRMRVLILEDYIRLHPEDFPPTERKKYADVLLPWVPRR